MTIGPPAAEPSPVSTPGPRRGPKVFRPFTIRPRLTICAAVGALIGILIPSSFHLASRCLMGWNAGVVIYFAVIARMMSRDSHESMRRRARELDEGRILILFFATVAAVVSLGAIVVELSVVKDLKGAEKFEHIALSALTIVTSWIFIHLMFALHYANEYFVEHRTGKELKPELRGGLHFPGTDMPHYIDFLYYSYTIGVASQTADVETTSRGMRTVTLAQSVVSFFFNTTILALTINIAAGLI